jgi:hypothetical protein
MSVTLTATLLSASVPQPVQIVLNGTVAGQDYVITGSAGGSTWTIPGGSGTSAGSQIVVIDNRAALNSPITYSAVVDGITHSAAPITVTYADVALIQSIDGLNVAAVKLANETDKHKGGSRSASFPVAGRGAPAIRTDFAVYDLLTWIVDTSGTDTATMQAILQSGNPVVRRIVAGVRDIPTVTLGQPSDWSHELLTNGLDTFRRWTISVQEIDDPQPSTALAAYTWDDFDLAMVKRLWSYYSSFATTTGWTATNGTLSNPTTGGYSDNGHFARVTVTTAATAAKLYESANNTAAAASDVWTVTCRVKGTAGRTAQAGLTWSGGTNVLGTAVTLTGSWQQVSVTATAPSGTTGFKVGATLAATGVLAGDLLDIDSFTVSRGSTVPVGTFDELWQTWDSFDTTNWASLQ